MNTYIEIEEYLPMTTKKKGETPITTRKNYTDSQGIRIRETTAPAERPPYSEWVRQIGINELAYQMNPAGRERARTISERLGTRPHPTWLDQLLGRDVWDAERFDLND
jgi:hypothetical protein